MLVNPIEPLCSKTDTSVSGTQPQGLTRFTEPQRGQRRVKTRYGIYMRPRWADATFHFCALGRYGRVLSEFLDAQTEAFTFVDIGANQGLFSLIAARNPVCKSVHAFEPVRTTYQYLLDNIALNAATKVLPHNVAIATRNGKHTIGIKHGHSGAATLRPDTSALSSALYSREHIRTVNAGPLTGLLKSTAPYIVKIDVEGHEQVVMEQLSLAGTLERTRAIYYEINEKWTDPHNLQTLLQQWGFCHFQVCGSGKRYDILASRNSV